MSTSGVAQAVPSVGKPFVEKEVTFIIKAFERPTCVTRLLKSIAEFYPGVEVLVLDDSTNQLVTEGSEQWNELHTMLPKLKYIRADYDVGLAAGRNIMVSHVKTPYVLLLDDDFELLNTSHIDHLLPVLQSGMFDLAGGCIDSAWSYRMTHEKDKLELTMDVGCNKADGTPRDPVFETEHVMCFKVDMINNFFMGRTEFLKGRWDPTLKLGEHEDFFMRVKQDGGRVGLCRGITANNDNSCDKSPAYKKLRSRVFDFWVAFFQKHKLNQMKTAAGVYTLKCENGNDSCSIEAQQDNIWFK